MMHAKKWGPKHEAFCKAYVSNQYTLIQCYSMAGWSGTEGNKGSAWRLLQRPDIKKRIAEMHADIWEQEKIHIGELLSKYHQIINFNLHDIVDEEGRIDPAKITREQWAAIESWEVDEFGTGSKSAKGNGTGQRGRVIRRKMRVMSKIDALNALMRHVGGFIDKVEATGAGGAPISIQVELVKAPSHE
jgi:hypothetical protein